MILGNNVAGFNGKEESLIKLMEILRPGVIMLQETKLYKEGKIKLGVFFIFEKLRKYKGGGGLMTAIHENLKPILVEDDDDDTNDIMVVDFQFDGKTSVRTINGYGPQEYSRNKNVMMWRISLYNTRAIFEACC